MSLTKADLQAIAEVINITLDEKLDVMLDEKLDRILDEKLDRILDEKLDRILDEKLDRILDEKLDDKLDKMFDEKFDTRFDEKLQPIRNELTDLRLHIENVTDKNIALLAENHLSLVDKVNEAVKVADKTALFEIQVRILTDRVDKLSQDVDILKSQSA